MWLQTKQTLSLSFYGFWAVVTQEMHARGWPIKRAVCKVLSVLSKCRSMSRTQGLSLQCFDNSKLIKRIV